MIKGLKNEKWFNMFESGEWLITTLIKIQKWYTHAVYLFVWILILYIVYLNRDKLVFDGRTISDVSNIASDDLLVMWQFIRNKLLKVIYFDLLIMLPIGIYYLKLENYAVFAKLIYKWFMLIVFTLFSYAISGLIIDLVTMLIYLNFVILNK